MGYEKKYSFVNEMDYKREGVVRYALGYPNNSFIGYSYLGLHLIHEMINMHKLSVGHHFFSLPDFPEKTPTYKIPLDEYHFIGFSVPFEPDYINIKKHLEKLNIPLLKKDREDIFPIIFAGGPAITINPLPLIPFVDIFFIGEAEGSLDIFTERVGQILQNGKKKSEILKEISNIKGVYIPEYHGKNYFKRRNILKNMENYPSLNRVKVQNTVFANMYLLEIQRGCPFSCKFCASRVISAPFRYRSFEEIVNSTKHIEDGANLGLIGTAILSHPQIYEILEYFANRNIRLHFASLRADLITEEILEYLKRNKVKTLTLAPEVATLKMQKEINKFVNMEKTISMLPLFYKNNIRDIKMYFLYGLPQEKDSDLIAIKELVMKVKDNFNGSISVSINPVVPKKHTPYENYLPPDQNIMKEKYKLLKTMFKKTGIKTSIQSPSMLYKQHKFSCGDETTLL